MVLYKYFAASRVDTLKSLLLRFTQPILFNDPFEALPLVPEPHAVEFVELNWEEGLRIAYRELKIAGHHEMMGEEFRNTYLHLLQEAVSAAKADPLFASLCQTGSAYQMISSMGVGALCLAERPDNSLMWSHYASDCKGFVVGFDTGHEWFRGHGAGELPHEPTKVSYSAERPTGMEDLYFRKSADWEYEQEWRMVCSLNDCDRVGEHVFVREVPRECVVSVLLGCRMEREDRIELLRHAKELPNARLFRTYPGVHHYTINAVPYELAFHIPYFSPSFEIPY